MGRVVCDMCGMYCVSFVSQGYVACVACGSVACGACGVCAAWKCSVRRVKMLRVALVAWVTHESVACSTQHRLQMTSA